jgi:hypothetical protein
MLEKTGFLDFLVLNFYAYKNTILANSNQKIELIFKNWFVAYKNRNFRDLGMLENTRFLVFLVLKKHDFSKIPTRK